MCQGGALLLTSLAACYNVGMSKAFRLAKRIAKIRGEIHSLQALEKKLLAELNKINPIPKKSKRKKVSFEDYLNAPAIEPSNEPWFGDIVWD